ncbi:hypothetical protein NDU88_001850 [Pleurodeles waltl]|uniref:Uncharacterized protein n=1 Tax=Pleurodeles waltl TaxID=8319 RepID=A0AAV7QBA1_PLEWA|nr:hypothetical protein NDU88_001850 [Pleurodeles waltl]
MVREIFSVNELVVDVVDKNVIVVKEKAVHSVETVLVVAVVNNAVYVFVVDGTNKDVFVNVGTLIDDLSEDGAGKGFLKE